MSDQRPPESLLGELAQQGSELEGETLDRRRTVADMDEVGGSAVMFCVTMEGLIEVAGAPGASGVIIEAHLDDVMDELLSLDAEDPAIGADVATGHVTIDVVVSAANPIGAVAQASGLLRTAVHAAGGSTPDWPNEKDFAWGLQLRQVRSAQRREDSFGVRREDSFGVGSGCEAEDLIAQ